MRPFFVVGIWEPLGDFFGFQMRMGGMRGFDELDGVDGVELS